jgi:hypothetical protein
VTSALVVTLKHYRTQLAPPRFRQCLHVLPVIHDAQLDVGNMDIVLLDYKATPGSNLTFLRIAPSYLFADRVSHVFCVGTAA